MKRGKHYKPVASEAVAVVSEEPVASIFTFEECHCPLLLSIKKRDFLKLLGKGLEFDISLSWSQEPDETNSQHYILFMSGALNIFLSSNCLPLTYVFP